MADAGSTSITLSGIMPSLLITYGKATLHVEGEPLQSDLVLVRACASARAKGEAMAALLASIADLPPTEARHDAAYAAVGQLRPGWEDDVATACRHPARTAAGLHAKAELAAKLFDRETDGTVVGSPAVRLAASLADDVFCAGWHRA